MIDTKMSYFTHRKEQIKTLWFEIKTEVKKYFIKPKSAELFLARIFFGIFIGILFILLLAVLIGLCAIIIGVLSWLLSWMIGWAWTITILILICLGLLSFDIVVYYDRRIV